MKEGDLVRVTPDGLENETLVPAKMIREEGHENLFKIREIKRIKGKLFYVLDECCGIRDCKFHPAYFFVRVNPETLKIIEQDPLGSFLNNYKKSLESQPHLTPDFSRIQMELISKMLESGKLRCPKCGNNTLKWGCGHDI